METDFACKRPTSVFKFYSLADYNVEAFVTPYLYLNHPGELNDLMDTKPDTLDMRDVDVKHFESFREEAIRLNPLMKNLTYVGDVDVHSKNGLYALRKFIFDYFFACGGLVSFASKDRFNELMWSHYTKESGFMIEFKTEVLLRNIEKHNKMFNQLFFYPISYREHPIGIRCTENPYEQKSIYDINKNNSYQKYEGWSYENEWRIVAILQQYLGDYNYYSSKQADEFKLRKLYYSDDSIGFIYLGKRFWTYDNFVVKIERIDDRKERYILQEPCICCEKKRYHSFIRFLQKLIQLRKRINIYISGACDCGEFRFGTDDCSKEGSFNPEYYYLTRSFVKIENISFDDRDNAIVVEYSGEVITQNEHFDSEMVI